MMTDESQEEIREVFCGELVRTTVDVLAGVERARKVDKGAVFACAWCRVDNEAMDKKLHHVVFVRRYKAKVPCFKCKRSTTIRRQMLVPQAEVSRLSRKLRGSANGS